MEQFDNSKSFSFIWLTAVIVGIACWVGYVELLAKYPQDTWRELVEFNFWQGLGVIMLAGVGAYFTYGTGGWTFSLSWALPLLLFGLSTGFAYTVSNAALAALVGSAWASLLAVGEIPVTIFIAQYILNETVSVLQGIGMVIGLTGTIYLLWQKAKKQKKQ
ncbi:MAG TPA: hypothetical protein VEA59_03950 [Patescibacteria group bacterium]|nr:hypothetical protein [Patescibacteria group bacterium]